MQNAIQLFAPHSLRDATIEFYVTEFDFALTLESENKALLRPPQPGMRDLEILFQQGSYMKQRTGISFHVVNFEDALAAMLNCGFVVDGSLDRTTGTYLIEDPAGNEIEIQSAQLN